MSYRYGPALRADAYTYGRGGLGIPAELVPAEGADGPAYFYGALSLPADNGVEIRAVITRWPELGTLTLDGDEGRFSYVGASDYILWELRANNQPTTGDIGHGPGIGRTNLLVGATSELTGAITLDPVLAAGAMTGGSSSALAGAVQLDDAAAAGALTGGSASGLAGAVQLDDATAAGSLAQEGVSAISGGVALADAVAAGELQGAVVSELGGAVQLADAFASGAFFVAGDFVLDNISVTHVRARKANVLIARRSVHSRARAR